MLNTTVQSKWSCGYFTLNADKCKLVVSDFRYELQYAEVKDKII